MAVNLILGITMGFAAAVQPGATQTFIISRSLIHGWKHALPLATVYLVSDIPIVAVVLLLLNIVPDWAITVLRLAGGLFLLYLAWGALKAFRHYNERQSVSQSAVKNYSRAVVINLLNPNPYLQWSLIMGPLVLNAWQRSSSEGIAVVAGFYSTIILTTAAIIVLFGVIRRLGAKISRILTGVSAVALAGFGIYQIFLGVMNLLS